MNTLFIILTITVLIRVLNQYRIRIVTLQTGNLISKLNQDVTLDYLEGRIQSNKVNIQSFRTFLDGTKTVMPRMTLWTILYRSIVFSSKLPQIKIDHEQEMRKCPELSSYYVKFSEISTNYLFKKSIFSLIFTGLIIFLAKHISTRCARWWLAAKEKVRVKFEDQQDLAF